MITPDKILQRELGKIPTAMGNIINPVLFGKPRDPSTNLTAKMAATLPDDTYEEKLDIPMSSSDSLKLIFTVLSKEGKITDDVSSDEPSLSAIVPSGFLGMNPAVVSVIIESSSSSTSHIVVRGISKEGLIKQHGGEKAAKKVISAIHQNIIQE